MGIDNDSPRTYEAVHDSGWAWEPGPGWYVVDDRDPDTYIAFCGPDDTVDAAGVEVNQEYAERIARALTASEL